MPIVRDSPPRTRTEGPGGLKGIHNKGRKIGEGEAIQSLRAEDGF